MKKYLLNKIKVKENKNDYLNLYEKEIKILNSKIINDLMLYKYN